VDVDLKHASLPYVENRSSGFPRLQVRSIWPGQRGHPISVSPRSREPWLHEGIPEGAQPAVDGAAAPGSGWADVLQARLLSEGPQRTTRVSIPLPPYCTGRLTSFLGLFDWEDSCVCLKT